MKRKIVVAKDSPIVISLQDALKELLPLPHEAVFMGVADDTLPVLFNVLDSKTSNVVVWDMIKGNGLRVLKVISEFLFKYHNNDVVDTEFLVITQSPSDWEGLSEMGMGVTGRTSCIGVVPFYGELTKNLLDSVVQWIRHQEKFHGSKKPIMILVDGLEHINDLDEESQRNFHRILTGGRKRNVYVISTAMLKNGKDVERWMGYIRYHVVARPDNWFESREPNGDTLLFFTPETEI
jgi:hypothetical protein